MTSMQMRDPTQEPPTEERKEGDVDAAKAENSDEEPQSQDPIARYTEPKYYYVHLKVSVCACVPEPIAVDDQLTICFEVEIGNGSLAL